MIGELFCLALGALPVLGVFWLHWKQDRELEELQRKLDADWLKALRIILALWRMGK